MVVPEIHEVDESQIHNIIALAEEIWLPTFRPFFSSLELQSLFDGMYATDKLKDWFGQTGNQMFTIGTKEDPIGYFAIAQKENKFWLDKIYIHPQTQGTGLGYSTWNWVNRFAAKKHYSEVWLRVNRRNKQAIDFYLKVGFKIDSSADFEGPNGFIYDDYLMNCPVL